MNKNTQKVQNLLGQGSSFPHIAQIPDLESQHGDPDHSKNLIIYCFLHHCRVILKFHQNLLIICCVMAEFPIKQSAWRSLSQPKFNHLFLLPPRPLHKISSQSVHKVLSDASNRQTDKQTN